MKRELNADNKKFTDISHKFILPAPKEMDNGFLGNMGALAVGGAKRLLKMSGVGQAVTTGIMPDNAAETIASELTTTHQQPKELKEAQESFLHYDAQWKNAKNRAEKVGIAMKMMGTLAKEAVTNHKGAAYLIAEQAANMAPPIALMIAGGKLGLLGGPYAPVTVPAGAAAGLFTGTKHIEQSLEVVGFIDEALKERGMTPTTANVQKILDDPEAYAEVSEKTRAKANTTALVDLLFMGASARLLTKATRNAAKVAARTGRPVVAPSLASRAAHGVGAIGLDTVGEGVSDASGRVAATGDFAPSEVAMEMFGGLGGSIVEVPTAARVLAGAAKKRVMDTKLKDEPTVPPTAPPGPTAPEKTNAPVAKEIVADFTAALKSGKLSETEAFAAKRLLSEKNPLVEDGLTAAIIEAGEKGYFKKSKESRNLPIEDTVEDVPAFEPVEPDAPIENAPESNEVAALKKSLAEQAHFLDKNAAYKGAPIYDTWLAKYEADNARLAELTGQKPAEPITETMEDTPPPEIVEPVASSQEIAGTQAGQGIQADLPGAETVTEPSVVGAGPVVRENRTTDPLAAGKAIPTDKESLSVQNETFIRPAGKTDLGQVSKSLAAIPEKQRRVNRKQGAQNAITRMIEGGGVRLDKSYNKKQFKEDTDGKRLIRGDAKYTFDEWADILNDEGYNVGSGDDLAQAVNEGRARDFLTPERAERIINLRQEKKENEYYSDERIAELESKRYEEEGIDPGRISESRESLEEVFVSEIAEAESLSEAEIDAALLDCDDFFSAVGKTLQPKNDESIIETKEATNNELESIGKTELEAVDAGSESSPGSAGERFVSNLEGSLENEGFVAPEGISKAIIEAQSIKNYLDNNPDRRFDAALRKELEGLSHNEVLDLLAKKHEALKTDPITGLKSKAAYENSEKLPYQASIDLDGLKFINDTYGHEAGDAWIKKFGSALGRASNNVEAYRVGGDEFVLQGQTAAELTTIVNKTKEILKNEPLEFGGQQFTISFSNGIATSFKEADAAMFEDKKARKSVRGEKPKEEITEKNQTKIEGTDSFNLVNPETDMSKNKKLSEQVTPENEDIPLQRDSQSTGMKAADVQSVTDKAVSSIPNAPKVNVVQSNNDCPAEVQKIMEQEGIDDAMGFTWNGEVYLIADNLRNTDEALRTLAHELTHSGLGKFFQRQTKGKLMPVRVKYEALMDAIYRAHGKEIEQIAKTTHTHLNTRTVHGRRQACEEWLCNQTYEAQHKWYDKLVAIFNDLLRAIGLDVKLSDAEVRVVLQDAFKEFGSEGVSFMTAWQGGPHDFNQEVLVESPDGTREYLVGTPDIMPKVPDGYKVIKEFPKGRHRSDKIGTGEGAQAYGYGHYFGSKREVAEFYRDSLANAGITTHREPKSIKVYGKTLPHGERSPLKNAALMVGRLGKSLAVREAETNVEYGKEKFDLDVLKYVRELKERDIDIDEGTKGHLYQVELAPEEDEYLLWDKPLSEQSEKVRKALAGNPYIQARHKDIESKAQIYTRPIEQIKDMSGATLYELLSSELGPTEQVGKYPVKNGSDKAASEYLHSLGIRGIKYLDGSSRGKGEGNYNYVIFDESDIEITAKFQRRSPVRRSQPMFSRSEDSMKKWWEGMDIQKQLNSLPLKFWQKPRNFIAMGYVPITRAEADQLYYDGMDIFVAQVNIKGELDTTGNEGLFMRPRSFYGYRGRNYDGTYYRNEKAEELYRKYSERYSVSERRREDTAQEGMRADAGIQGELQKVAEPDTPYSVTKDKGTGQITAKDNPTPEAELIEEAKKYDSAEEFVNAQNTTEAKLLRAQIASDAGKYDRDHWGTMDEIANELPEYKNLMTGMYKEDSFGNKKLPKYDEKTKLIEEAIDDYINKDKKVFIGWDRIQTKTGDTTVPVVYFKTPHGEASFHMVKWGIGYVKGNMVGYNKLLFNIKAEGYEDNLRPMYMQIPKKYEKLFNKDYKWNGEKKTREVLEKNFSETKNQLINIYNKAHSLPNPSRPPEGTADIPAKTTPQAEAWKDKIEADAKDGWYIHGRGGTDDLLSEFKKHEIFVSQEADVAEDYAGSKGSIWQLRPKQTANVLDATDDTQRAEVVDKLKDQYESGALNNGAYVKLSQTIDDEIESYGEGKAWERIDESLNPRDIVEDEGFYSDTDFVNWLYENFEYDFVSTNRGGVAYNPDAFEIRQFNPNPSRSPESEDIKYAKAGNVVDGRNVRKEIPNLSSIEASIVNPTILPGIYEIPLTDFDGLTGTNYSKTGQNKINKLADEISASNEITPLIVAIDKDGPYILEGATRAEALYKIGAKSFPAKVVIDGDLPTLTRPTEVGGPMFSRAPKDPPEKGASVEAINNYLKDETDAAVKVILTKFPEWFEQSWPGQKLKSTLNDPDFKPKRETSWLEALIASPEWLQNPHINKIVRLFMRDRSEIFHETFNDLNSMDDINAPESTVTEAAKALRDKGVSFADRVKGKVSKEYALLDRFIDEGDTVWAHMHKDKPMEERINLFKEHMKKNGATGDVLKVWQAMRESYDKALDLQMAQMRQMLAEIMERSAWNKLTDPRMIEMTGKLDKLTAAMNAEKFKTKKAKIQKEINAIEKQIDDLAQAIEDTEIGEMRDTLKGALAQMNEWRGFYAPRIREQGAWQILAYKEHGPLKENREWHREHKMSQLAAEKRANQLRRDGYKVYNVGKQDRLPEGIYQDVNAVATAKLIDSALEKLANKQGENVAVKINEEVLRAVSDEIKARGFRSHMIHRQEGPVVRGFIEDSIERHILYLNQLSSGIAKAKVAKMAMAELLGERINGEQVGGMNPKDDPRAYEIATNYIREQLRNLDRSDQIIGLAKSIATFKFLGFNLRSLAVNTTAIATTAPTTIHQYALGGKGSMFSIYNAIGKAGKDYGMVMAGKDTNLSGDEKSFIEDFHRKGWDDAQYVRDATGEIMKSHSKVWNFLMDKSMWGFGVSEKWNRGTTMLAAYRLGRKQGMNHAQASEAAKNASDKAHGVYGRATLPMWAMGANPAAKVGQLMYVYMKFSHNYLQMLYDVGLRKKNVKGLMFAMLSPIILAGGAAWPFKDELFAFAGAILKLLGEERDPEKWVWDQIRKHVGPTAEKVGRHGLTGAMGVDISGSLSIGVGIPKGLIDLTGAIGGVAGDVKEAGEAVGRGQYGRAAEYLLPTGIANIPRAYRESTQGATTRQNRPVWDEQGKPYKPGAGATASRVLGFRSVEQAVLSERTWEGRREQTRMNDKRKDIYEKYRAWLIGRGSKEDHARIMEDVKKYNKSIENIDGVSKITFKSLRDQARRVSKPSKRERAILSD